MSRRIRGWIRSHAASPYQIVRGACNFDGPAAPRPTALYWSRCNKRVPLFPCGIVIRPADSIKLTNARIHNLRRRRESLTRRYPFRPGHLSDGWELLRLPLPSIVSSTRPSAADDCCVCSTSNLKCPRIPETRCKHAELKRDRLFEISERFGDCCRWIADRDRGAEIIWNIISVMEIASPRILLCYFLAMLSVFWNYLEKARFTCMHCN